MQNIIQINIAAKDSEQSEILISMLSDIGFYAFESEEDFSAYIMEVDFNENQLKEILAEFNLQFQKNTIAPTNWNAKWESDFEPVIVDDFVAVRASFHEPVKTVAHEIIITPKMSFGTGHHATTFLMLQAMEDIDFKNKNVTDYGTGTGVLAILAAKLGADVIAIDNDEWSIENAKENFALNNTENIELIQKEDPLTSNQANVILANINLHILKMNVHNFKFCCKPDGILMVSGFLENDIPELKQAFETNGFSLISFDVKDKWVCGKFTKL